MNGWATHPPTGLSWANRSPFDKLRGNGDKLRSAAIYWRRTRSVVFAMAAPAKFQRRKGAFVYKNEDRAESLNEGAFQFIDRNKDEIARIGDAVFYFGELGMQEFRTSEYTADALRQAGFKIETGISGMPPAWMATWGSGPPVIGIHCEADALPKGSQMPGVTEKKPIIDGAPGHAEGHNTNIAVMIGGAVAAKTILQKANMPGTIKLFLAPAEEQGIPRPYFLRDGYFDGIDAIFHTHVGSEFSAPYGIRQSARISADFIFHGKSAHSATNPWLARNALDAVTLMDVGWALMRQQMPPSQTSHRVIVNGGDQPNVIPSYTKVWWYFREKDAGLAMANFEKAKTIAEGAALMTGCTFEVSVRASCWPTRASKGMSEIIHGNMERVGMPEWSEEEEGLAKEIQTKIGAPVVGLSRGLKPLREAKQENSSNDSGCVSWVIPTGRITFPANIPGCEFHSWPAGVSLATTIAHKGEVHGAKVLAGSMLDLFANEELLIRVKEIFKKEIGDVKYVEPIPENQKPPVDLNRETMEKWRPLMEKFYIKEKVRWKE